jgi:hypothetical protein
MIVEHYFENIRYTLSNDNLEVEDEVYPIAQGRCTDDNEFMLYQFRYEHHMSGFPDKPHIIEDLNYDSSYKPYQIRTDKGYGPIEKYYKIIKKEKKTENDRWKWETI